MPMDGITLYGINNEIKAALLEGRVDKVFQPSETTLVFKFRSSGEAKKLLIDIHPDNCRVHLAWDTPPNPPAPPLFCMVLRKKLEGAKLIDIHQYDLDRLIEFSFVGLNELGDTKKYYLVAEIMGKHSNLVLLDEERIIIDALKKYNFLINRYREIYPGIKYILPPAANKLNLLSLKEEDLYAKIISCGNLNMPKALQEAITGLSMILAKEICYQTDCLDLQAEETGEYELHRLFQKLMEVLSSVEDGTNIPCLALKQKVPAEYSIIPLEHLEKKGYLIEKQAPGEISKTIESFYYLRMLLETFNKEKKFLEKKLDTVIEKLEKKKLIHEESLREAEDVEEYRIKGELITSAIYKIKKGMTRVLIENYYENNNILEIDLDPTLSPSGNASRWFKKYAKAKERAKNAKVLLLDINDTLFYLYSIKESIPLAENIEDLGEIRNELIKARLLSAVAQKKTRQHKESVSEPIKFISSEGLEILVGKNNRQNDYLTLKVAGDKDIWLHAENIPGAHVILKTDNKIFTNISLIEAATIAAYYSKAKNGGKVSIVYTERKNVKKPSGSKPGMVIYEPYKSILVVPDESEIIKLKMEV